MLFRSRAACRRPARCGSLDSIVIPADLYLAFIAATAVLMIVPGPNVALIVANSVAHGTRYGLLTVAATSTAVVIHLILTVLGASAVLDVPPLGMVWLGGVRP